MSGGDTLRGLKDMRFFKKDPPTSHGGRGKKGVNHNNNVPVIEDSRKQVYHWQSEGGTKKSTVDDMVLLTKITESAITENLKKRLMEDKIYTYIGPVLVAVNPFKQLSYFTDREVELYQGAAQYEVPPHIYSVADTMYRNMLIDSDSQCVIISGESGAGKTVSAKFIMNYITKVSGGGQKVQHVKDIILESNPLLEAFGNAKTTRNNNSSRFGKYIEIQFSRGGEPLGGKISNFLLEKSRVHSLNEGERNFHIFYQICAGASDQMKESLGVTSPDYFSYLSQSGVYKVDGTNDAHDFQETRRAMNVMGIPESTEMDILRVVAAILHLGNVTFLEQGNASVVSNPQFLEFPAYLLGIDAETLGRKLVSRIFDSKWGGKSERVDVTLNIEQAQFTRDAWTKGLYSRLFDYIVDTINKAMVTNAIDLSLGILDIYGFEIFGRNGFEQFCINYVNEKLQQIFIELTLKSEQEEYHQEGIQWTPIQFFDNKIVCELIESKRPPGIMCILDDTCATMSAVSQGADEDFRRKMDSQVGSNPHYRKFNNGFVIKHYAGDVSYHLDSFCEKNRDVMFQDIIEVMQSSQNAFIRSLFPDVIQTGSKGRPTTAGSKIRTQANDLVTTLTLCVPHYIRCIKPNETKKPHDWDDQMVKHQVEYLGLKENIKVKRAGFAYRRPFEKFLHRYAVLTKETFPSWHGDKIQGILIIMKNINMDLEQYQIGRTKVFVKDPESLYMLEELRERKFDHYARVIQQCFRKHFSKQIYLKERMEASNLVHNRKERRSNSLNRNFHGDYIGVEYKRSIAALIPRREKVEFALTVDKFDRRFRTTKRDLILTKSNIYLIGRVKVQKGPEKGQIVDVIKRQIDLESVTQATLSNFQDDIVLLHVRNDYESLLDIRLKTEFLMLLNRKLREKFNRELPLNFVNSFDYHVRKTGWGGGGMKKVVFIEGNTAEPVLSSSGSTLTVKIGHGLPASSMPGLRRNITPDIKSLASQTRAHARAPGNTYQSNGYPPQNNRPSMPTRPSPAPHIHHGAPPIPHGAPPIPHGAPPIPLGAPPIPHGAPPRSHGAPPIPHGAPPIPHSAPTSRLNGHLGRQPSVPSNHHGYPPRPRNPAPIPSSQPPIPRSPAPRPMGPAPVIPSSAPPRLPGMYLNPHANQASPVGPSPGLRGSSQVSAPQFRLPVSHPPPPPSDPAPADTPTIGPGTLRPIHGIRLPSKPVIDKPKPRVPQVKAIYSYNASDTDELTFNEGDILQLVKEDNSGWWTCKHNGRQGFCPENYLQKI